MRKELRTWILLSLGAMATSGAVGCSGIIDGPGGAGAGADGPGAGSGIIGGKQVPLACDLGVAQAAEERIYRLTPEEYLNSVRALLGDDSLQPAIDSDEEVVATLVGVRKWLSAAKEVVPSDTAWMSDYVECNPAADEVCAVAFVESFAEAAFRRPLLADEKEWLSGSWGTLPQDAPLAERLRTMAQMLLQAPQFIYLYSEGTPIPESPHRLYALNGYERAQRLSYFLWDAPPDAELLDAAASGALDDGEGMRAQAERMLEDDRAKPVLRHFLSEWLELEGATILPGLDETPKDGDLFPVFNDPLRVAMRKEIEAFMDYVMFERDGSLEALFTDTRAYVNGPLAELYGVSDGPSDADTWEWVELDATQRAGMLTRAGFLAVHASQTATSPIRRGVYMLREVLCYDLPPPPADVDNTPIEATDLDETKTPSVREETMRRTGNASCSGCHVAINELGFAFEHYNAIGQWQDKEVGGAVIDASSTLRHAGGELDGPIDGAIELSSRLAMSPSVAACASERWFEMALRRIPGDLDECSLAEIAAKTEDSGSIRDLLLAVVESDAFVSVNHGVDGLGEGK